MVATSILGLLLLEALAVHSATVTGSWDQLSFHRDLVGNFTAEDNVRTFPG